MNAKSIKGKSTEEIKKELDKILDVARPSRNLSGGPVGRAHPDDPVGRGFKPTLAIVFLSLSQDRKSICEILSNAGIKIFGVTTNGEFIDENPEKFSVAILLLDMKPAHFSILFAEYPEKNYREVSQTIAQKAKQLFTNPAFLVAGSHMETDAEQVLFGFEDEIGEDVNVFGGMAGDDYTFSQQFVFTNNQESNRGLVVLALDEDKVKIKGRATCGWKAVGTEKTVTKSEGNHVFTVDNIPALDITAKYGGIENVTPDNEGLLMELATSFPLQLQRQTGEPVMRPSLVVDWSDRSFYCSGTVPQGSKVRFSLPPDFDVMEKVIHNTQEMKANEMPEADALIVFSCAGRIIALGPMMNMEIEGVKKVWNVPMVGMFSNAELGRTTKGNLEMHNLTTCCIALKEK